MKSLNHSFNVINYHITNRCNYHCNYCFGKFERQKDPTLKKAKQIVDNIASCFEQNRISHGRINLAGGEPTLYADLDELITYIHSLGMLVSIITNGSTLTPEHIRAWQGKVSQIGISIDSLDRNTNLAIGRCCQSTVVQPSDLIALSKAIHECNIKLKINTVVSRKNLNEDFLPLYQALQPDKIKLLQMHLIHDINDEARSLEITEPEFYIFCQRHSAFKTIIVPEPCGSMENSYLMINPAGEFQINNSGAYQIFGNLNSTSLFEILKKAPLDSKRFSARYQKEVQE